jgi:hypothetical protein
MIALGYNEYVFQGGDWGRMVLILCFSLFSRDGSQVRSEARRIVAYQHAHVCPDD